MLQNLLKAISPDETKMGFSRVDNELSGLKKDLKGGQTEADSKLKSISDRLDSLTNSFRQLPNNEYKFVNIENKLSELESIINDFSTLSQQDKQQGEKQFNGLNKKIENLLSEVSSLSSQKPINYSGQIKSSESKVLQELQTKDEAQTKGRESLSQSFENELKKLKSTFQGGGSMNRQIRVEGVDVLTRYTDINIYGVTSSVITSTDNTNKRINIGIQGGGGSGVTLKTNGTNNGSQTILNLKQGTNVTVADDGVGGVTISATAGSVVSGITRVSSVISVSSTIAAATLTDYVVHANVGINLTLPSAISNTNLYTVKNLVSSSVLLSVTGGQSIDGSSTALLTNQYQSLSLISNGSVWSVV